MGKLNYSIAVAEVDIDDRLLAHLHLVINERFRRRESFYLRLSDPRFGSDAVAWMDHNSALRFTYVERTTPQINREWVEQLLANSYKPSGLVITAEPTTL